MVDEDKNEIEIEVTPIESFAEFDVWMIISILEQGHLGDVDWYWLSNKFQMLLDGTPPDEVFPRIGREVQKCKTTERDIELTKIYAQMRNQGLKKAAILEALSVSENISESVIETAWKRWGKFFPES